MSHCVSAMLFGGHCSGIGVNFSQCYAYSMSWCVHDDIVCTRIHLIAGSFVSCCFGFLLRSIGYRTKLIGLYFGTSTYIISEFFYWGLSPIIITGDGLRSDGYRLLQTTNINPWLFLIFIVIGIYIFVKTIKGSVKIWQVKKK